ncbi:MAG: VOC family protein [Anaerolineae bacterium]
MYHKVTPMFLVENVDKAVAWYGNTLGTELRHSLPKTPPFEWVSLLLGDIEIMFSQKGAAQKWYSDGVTVSEIPANFIAYIYVKHANSLYERVKGKVTIIMEPTDQWYGMREFAIRDPFGFILIFAQIVE